MLDGGSGGERSCLCRPGYLTETPKHLNMGGIVFA